MPPQGDHGELKRLLEKNAELIKENNTLLRKLHRNSVIGIVTRIIWYALLIGLPFLIYFYFLEPYFAAFGSDYQLFREGVGELPLLKIMEDFLPKQ